MAASAVVLSIGDQYNKNKIENASYCQWVELDGGIRSGL